jgi:hypothetical protein
MKENQVCVSCEEPLREETVYFGEPKTHYEGKPLCESCFYDIEPLTTVFYGKDKEPHLITLARNETDGDFTAGWYSTDPWRGYYVLSSDKYTSVFSDAILADHESEAMLKELNDKGMDDFDKRKIEYARSFSRTSNVFSTGYDIWVSKEPEQILIAHLALERIKKEVDFSNPLYSTGIIMDREALGKLRTFFKGKYELHNDNDLMKLINKRGEELLAELQELYSKGDSHRD